MLFSSAYLPNMAILSLNPTGLGKDHLPHPPSSCCAAGTLPVEWNISPTKALCTGTWQLETSYWQTTSNARFDHLYANIRCVGKHAVFQIGDFGLSRDLDENPYYITHKGTIPLKWSAPEVRQSTGGQYTSPLCTPNLFRPLCMVSSAPPVMFTAMECYCTRYGPVDASQWPMLVWRRCVGQFPSCAHFR